MDTNTEEFNKTVSDLNINKIKEVIEKFTELKVLIIGDTIIDQYVFIETRGRSMKDPMLSTRHLNEKSYAGGVLAVANSLSDFVKEIKVVTLIGNKGSKLEFIIHNIADNIELKTFIKENAPTTIKRRYIDYYRNNKMFKVEYINDEPISNELALEILEYLENEIPKYDLVIVCDFDHGFIND